VKVDRQLLLVVRREEADRVVPLVIAKSALERKGIMNEAMGGHQIDG
jgi:hypothetical protein